MFKGSIVALVTPWKDGPVDETAMRKMIEWHVEQGTDGFVPCGTTGESPTFTHAEQHDTIRLVVDAVAGRKPVLAGAGSNSTREAVSLAQGAERAGADGILSVTPYYNKPNQEGLFRHYKAVLEATSLPLMLYNVPGRTGVNLLPETAARLAEIGDIAGVKEASGNLGQALALRELGIEVVSGEDALTWPLMAVGACGVISVVANFAPRIMKELCDAALAGDAATAAARHRVISELAGHAFAETNPIPAKAAVAALGLCRDEFRLPLVPLDDARRAALLKAMGKYSLL